MLQIFISVLLYFIAGLTTAACFVVPAKLNKKETIQLTLLWWYYLVRLLWELRKEL